MKIKIRYGCFESNSSSQHSICVTKNDYILKKEDFKNYPEHLYINSNGEWNLCWNEEELIFGRHPFKFLCTFEDKVKFAIASLCSGENRDEQFDLIVQTVQSIYPKIKSINLPMIDVDLWLDANNEFISDSIVHYDYDDNSYYYIKNGHQWHVTKTDFNHKEPFYGEVDHQSYGLLQKFLKKEDISLKDFLENRKYVIIISGDEYDDWNLFKYSGLIDIKNIEKEFGI